MDDLIIFFGCLLTLSFLLIAIVITLEYRTLKARHLISRYAAIPKDVLSQDNNTSFPVYPEARISELKYHAYKETDLQGNLDAILKYLEIVERHLHENKNYSSSEFALRTKIFRAKGLIVDLEQNCKPRLFQTNFHIIEKIKFLIWVHLTIAILFKILPYSSKRLDKFDNT